MISVSQGGEEVVFQGGSQVLLQGGNQMAPSGARRSVQINLDQVCLFWILAFIFLPQKVEEMYIEEGTREMYEDQYDSHGVLIKRDDDQEGNFGEARLS